MLFSKTRLMFFTERWKLLSVIVYYRFAAAVAETFLQDTDFMSILSKRGSQASEDSLMYMGDRHIRQRAIIENNRIFPIICLHIAIRKVKISALNFFFCTLVILPLLFTCCKSYSRENFCSLVSICLFPIILTLFFARSKISAKQIWVCWFKTSLKEKKKFKLV